MAAPVKNICRSRHNPRLPDPLVMLASMAGRPVHEAPSPSVLPSVLLRYLAAQNADAAAVAAAGGLGVEAAGADEMTLTSTKLAAMLDACCEALAEPHL